MGGRAGGGARSGGGGGIGATERGFSKALASSIVAHENSIRGNNYETLKIFDDNGNLTYEKVGGAHSVSYDGSKSVNMIVTHNHPSGSAFSGADLKNAVNVNQKEIRATGKEYTFSMKRPATGWGKSGRAVMTKFNKLHKQASADYHRLKTGNAEKDRKLWIKLSTGVSAQIAKDYGWTFTVKKNK